MDSQLNKLFEEIKRKGKPKAFWPQTPEANIPLPYNITIFHQKWASPWFYKKNYHSRFVLLLSNDSPQIVGVEGFEFELKQNEAILMFPYQTHYYFVKHSPINWIFITFDAVESIPLLRLKNRIISLQPQNFQILDTIIQSYEAFTKSIRGASDSFSLALALLLAQFCQKLNPLSDNASAISSNKIVEQVGKLLRENPSIHYTVNTVASILNLSESSLRFKFKQATGLSLGKYLMNNRLAQACRLLRQSDLNISEIAYSCGFGSPETLSHAIKKAHGVSPREYRQASE